MSVRSWRRIAGSVVLTIALGAVSVGAVVRATPADPIRVDPAIAMAPIRVAGAVVRAPKREVERSVKRVAALRATVGEPVAVSLTAYCLRGTTRRSNPVRPGIVAADPRVFPLGSWVEVHVGDHHLGRFLVDDTGGAVKGAILDVWTPSCREARRFGRRKGRAVLATAAPEITPDVERLLPR